MLDPASCRHDTAYVVATIGYPGNDDPDASGLPWDQLPDHHNQLVGHVDQLLCEHFRPEGLDGIRAHACLGICSGCLRVVVTVRMGDHQRWTSEHGPAWSSRWTPLVRDGEQEPLPVPPAAAERRERDWGRSASPREAGHER